MWTSLLWKRTPVAAAATSLVCYSKVLDGKRSHLLAEPQGLVPPPPKGCSRIVFTGTGNSTGTPRPACLMQIDRCDPACRVSNMAMEGSPERNRNYRGNPGLLIQYFSQDSVMRNYQIDTGKTYRESLLRWYPRFGVPWIDAVILTHDHADACFGLDELRTVQRLPSKIDPTAMAAHRAEIGSTPVFVGKRHMERFRKVVPYLMPKPHKHGEVGRFVAKLDWIEVEDYDTFTCPGGLGIMSVPVQHGRDYICQAFIFGEQQRVAYLSDVSAVPTETMEVLETKKIDILIVDTLFEKMHPVHFGLADAVALAKKLRPRRTLLVGMSDIFEHDETNNRLQEYLKTDNLDIQLAHDGLYVDVRL